jgi:antitoxin component YwqK of YwqJK toxin-antitoxin module|tara:strand:+ start:1374 stop:1628 length:255 start_codon:yes stop_codon:yes gene_type:complete
MIFGCSKEPINNEALIEIDGLKYHPNTKKLYSGKVFDLYDNVGKKLDGTFKDGKREGKETYWYPNGQKSSEMTSKNEEKDGLCI